VTEQPQPLGYFRELAEGGPEDPSLADAVADTPQQHESELAAFLRAGSVLATTSKWVSDVLSGDPAPVAQLETRTDGDWFWPADLAYYVERYHVRLPDEFVAHAERLGWHPPALTEDQLVAVADRLVPS
jgi:hypothetical protein